MLAARTTNALEARVAQLEEMLGLRVDCDPVKLKALGLTRMQLDILKILLGARLATWSYITAGLWGSDPDGGPLDPKKVIHVQTSKMRLVLAAHGVAIELLWGEGYFLNDQSKAAARRMLGIEEN